MHISEVEKQTGLQRANIRFYEQQGLLQVARQENGYRDYTKEDVQVLQRIRLLREVQVPLDEIRLVIRGERSLETALERHVQQLEKEAASRRRALESCRQMMAAQEDFSHLDAEKYLKQLERLEKEEKPLRPHGAQAQPPMPKPWRGDREVFVPHPWKRYLARMLDLSVCGVLSNVLLNGVLKWHIGWLAPVFTLLLMLALESVQLHLFAQTFGKWVFGIRVTGEDGKKLCLRAALKRTGQVLLRGMGLHVFGLNILCMYFARRHYLERQCTPWDYENEVHFACRSRGAKHLAGALAFMVLLLGGLAHRGVYLSQWLPPHRGNITLQQFSQNYNAIARADARRNGVIDMTALSMDLLDENGSYYGDSALPDGVVVIDVMNSEAPVFEYTLKNGFVQAVSFELDTQVDGMLFTGCQEKMRRIILSLADVHIWDGSIPRMDARTGSLGFMDYQWELCGVRVSCDVCYDEEAFGYVNEDIRFSTVDNARYTLSFRAEKTNLE